MHEPALSCWPEAAPGARASARQGRTTARRPDRNRITGGSIGGLLQRGCRNYPVTVDAQATGTTDGRTLRAERTRQALVDALFSLLDDGEVRPTAERIAERAGVSERSVFQHFPDREALFEAVARQQYERVIAAVEPVDASRPLGERLDAFVVERARMLEQVSPVRRAALLLEHESDVVAGLVPPGRPGGAA